MKILRRLGALWIALFAGLMAVFIASIVWGFVTKGSDDLTLKVWYLMGLWFGVTLAGFVIFGMGLCAALLWFGGDDA